MKIVFVHNIREHLGLEYLSAVLKRAGHQVSLEFEPGLFSREDNAIYLASLEDAFSFSEKILKKIEQTKPDLVAFSVYTTNYIWAKKMAHDIKERIDTKIIFGGIHSTMFPEKILKNLFIDFVIRGEAENTMLELVNCLQEKEDYSQINNLCYRKVGQVFINPLRPLIENLDILPFPDKDLFENVVDYFSYMILTQRGCVFDCSFCCENYFIKLYRGKGSYFRKRSINSVISELQFGLNKYKFKEVIFFDSDLLIDREWLKKFLPKYNKIIHRPFKCLCRIINFNEEIAGLLKDSGCYGVNFGVQSWNENIRRNILNRSETNSEIRNAFSLCEKVKLKYDIDLIFNIPNETRNNYLYGLEQLKDCCFLNRVKCFKLAYFPMAEITKKFSQDNLISKQQLEKIEEGQASDIFHLKQGINKFGYRDIEIFYEIFPLFSSRVTAFLLNTKTYKIFNFFPDTIVYCFQFLISIKLRDIRFLVYYRNFIKRLKCLIKS
jgi:radical SAM superfamily enzyme YgiQ (UPF0313 family)